MTFWPLYALAALMVLCCAWIIFANVRDARRLNWIADRHHVGSEDSK